jgi:drug/metabolite transporter (DMT)-like permease
VESVAYSLSQADCSANSGILRNQLMSQRVRTGLGIVGFFAVVGVLMSDRFQDIRDAIPESVYYWVAVVFLAVITVVGFYAWWQNYNGRKMDPTVHRVKKWIERPSWWNWPF